MAIYSIKDVEKLTGIRPPTLRAWEQRYDLVVAHRDDNNVRFYRDEELRELTGIALLRKHGYRISKIARMTAAHRTGLVARLSSLNVSADVQLDALLLAVVELDEYRFGLLLDTNIDQRGFEETMMQVIYPFLDKLGVLFFTGSVTAVQEAFVGAMLRRKLMVAIDELPRVRNTELPVMALFLPPGERQEQSSLFLQYLIIKRGFRVIYLGPDTAPGDLADACAATHIDYLVTVLSSGYVARPVASLVEDILDRCPNIELLLAGYQASLQELDGFRRVTRLAGLKDLLAYVDGLSMPVGRSTALV